MRHPAAEKQLCDPYNRRFHGAKNTGLKSLPGRLLEGSPPRAHTAIALIKREVVVRDYLRQKGRVILRSTNPKYSDIEIAESDQFVIAGMVLRIVKGTV